MASSSVVQWGPAHIEVTPGNSERQFGGGPPQQRSDDVVVVCHSQSPSPDRDRGPGSRALLPRSAKDMLAAPVTRQQLVDEEAAFAPLPARALALAGLASTDDAAYWRPTQDAGECGLLESFARKAETFRQGAAGGAAGDGLDTFVLVCSRPVEELRRNFSNHRGQRVDLSAPQFQLSRSALAMHHLDQMHDDAALRGKDVKAGLRRHIPAMQEDAYYLVSYRDYSTYATSTFAASARRVKFGSDKFVERHFAVRVGQNSGVFILITAAQFARGWEMLMARHVQPQQHPQAQAAAAASAVANDEVVLTRWALTQDQFRSLGPCPVDVRDQSTFDRVAPVSHVEAAAAAASGDAGAALLLPRSLWYRPDQARPSSWDFTPGALQWRLQRHLETQYHAVGRVVVKGALVIGAVFMVRYALSQGGSDDPRARRAAPRRSWASTRRRDDRSIAEAFVDAILHVSPTSFAHYITGDY